jgi:hypothetical protein
MKYGLRFLSAVLFLFLALVLVTGCGQDQSSKDDIPPSAPVWLVRSADDSYPQQGIRAEPVQNDLMHQGNNEHFVRLEWYANPESDVVTYRVWRVGEHDTPQHHAPVKDLRLGVDVAEGQSTYFWVDKGDDPNSGTFNNLAPDESTGQSRGYYWELQAIDSAGNRSTLSPRIYYRLLANPSTLSVDRDSLSGYHFSYEFTPNSYDDVPLYDVLRIYSQAWGRDSLALFTTYHRYDTFYSLPLTFAHPLTRDCTYVCQVNTICNRANESHTDSLAGAAAFTTFKYQP